MESALHRRFEPARIRGEWFGHRYLPVILAFAEGLAEDAVDAYDDSGAPPELVLDGLGFCGVRELAALRAEIHRLIQARHSRENIALWLHLPMEEVEFHLEAIAAENAGSSGKRRSDRSLLEESRLRSRYREPRSSPWNDASGW